ncbi:hypothetical protein [Leuconostoc citreum]
MTFDESVREYQLRSSIGPLVQGMKLSPFVNVPQQEYDRVKFLNNLFYETINKLRQEYAPTVEMTKSQKDLILRNQDEDKLYEIMGDGDGYYFNAEYWGDLEPHEVASAYLHPETIKIVDE